MCVMNGSINMNMGTNVNKKARDLYWNNISVYNGKDEIDFHAAGADRDLSLGALSNADKLYLHYRFLIENQIVAYIIKKRVQFFKKTLDCGAGTGRISLRLSSLFDHVDSFDISQKFVTEFSSRYPNERKIAFVVSDFEKYNTDKKYDFIFVGGVFMCMNDDEIKNALLKIKGWLSPGGVLLCRDTLAKKVDSSVGFLKKYRTENEYMSLFSDLFDVTDTLNGANRNYFCTIFIHLPKLCQNNTSIFKFFKWCINIFIFLDQKYILLRGNKRHKLANQMLYAFKSK